MKILVVGCGKIGSTIIESLVAEGHDVTAIDSDASIVSEITNIYDCMGICGSGTDCNTLSEAEVELADLIVAVTGSDEFNMLSCFIARRMGAKHTIARIRNPEYNDSTLGFLCQQLRLSMAINPELLAAEELFNILKVPSAVKIETFSRRKFEMIELRLHDDSQLDGISLMELRKNYPAKFLICVIQRGDDVYIPDGNFVLKSGDRIGITAAPAEIVKLLKKLDLDKRKARNIMILGASRTAYYLAKMLINSGNSVKVVDANEERLEEFGNALPDAVMIKGDAAQQDVLTEEGLNNMDAFVSLTGIDEENILLSVFAAQQNVPKVISKVNRDEFADIAEKLGLDSIVSPKRIIADILVRYARALENSVGSKMETLYKVMDGKAEALEFNITDDCPLNKIPLKQLSLKPNTLIAGIIRGRKTIIPSGDDMILPGDLVVIFAAGFRVNDISDILE